MLNDFIGGGLVFLHKVRMFLQVADRSLSVALLLSLLITASLNYNAIQRQDWHAAITYFKAYTVEGFSEATGELREASGQRRKNKINVIKAQAGKSISSYSEPARNILEDHLFIKAKDQVLALSIFCFKTFVSLTLTIICVLFVIWSKLGIGVRKVKHLTGTTVKNAKEVAKFLNLYNKASDIRIGAMPLVKDSETRHILITGTTGSGKTNLINTIIPQFIARNNPALFLDQTGEMIARYYNPSRGDVIFNPLDARSHTWDFFKDMNIKEGRSGINDISPRADLEKFAKVLFNFGKSSNSNADPFWSNSAETIFCAIVESLIRRKDGTCNIKELQRMLSQVPASSLKMMLAGTEGTRYLEENNKNTAASILSVMAAATKPLNYLYDSNKSFSLKEYFARINNGSNAILFLSTPPGQREVIIPLISSIFELAVSNLINIGINEQRRFWFVLDELAALGRLNGLTTLLNEGRKYGACVIASTQSVNQVFENYGHYPGNSIFGQFATKFFFRNDEPLLAKMITDTFGQVEYQTKQKNTSFGAHEHRDGVSYTETKTKKPLITSDQLASLSDLECLVGLPEPEVRIAKVKLTKVTNVPQKYEGFIPKSQEEQEINENIERASLALNNAYEAAWQSLKSFDENQLLKQQIKEEVIVECMVEELEKDTELARQEEAKDKNLGQNNVKDTELSM